METVTEFEDHRSHLLGVAYRMLGSVTDAEDARRDCRDARQVVSSLSRTQRTRQRRGM
jgi:hypothetical protein